MIEKWWQHVFSVFTYSAAPTPYHSLFIEVLQEKVVAVAALLKKLCCRYFLVNSLLETLA